MKPTSGAKERTLFGEDDTIDLLGIYNMLLRRKWLILTVALIGAALAAGVGKLITPQYTAKSQIMLDPRKLQVTNIEQVLGGRSIIGLYPPTHEQSRADFAAWRAAHRR